MDANNHTGKICRPQHRCRNWRQCDFCARVRQARIADAAERLASISPNLSWTTLHPILPGKYGIDRARSEWVDVVRPAGAIWTIEKSPSTKNLHLNIIHPTAPDPILARSGKWNRPIIGNVRHVAAYISKRRQAPAPGDYQGRLFGTCGHLWQWLVGERADPIISAAAVQWLIDPLPMIEEAQRHHPLAPTYSFLQPPDYAEIAKKYLPDVLAMLKKPRHNSLAAEGRPREVPEPGWDG